MKASQTRRSRRGFCGPTLTAVGFVVSLATAQVQGQSAHEAAPRLGVAAHGSVGTGTVNALEAGLQFGVRWSAVEWTALGASALFPSEGGFVRLDTGLNLFMASAYVGAGGGVSRFDLGQPFIFARLGVIHKLGAIPLRLEGRFERHGTRLNGGRLLLLSAGVQMR